jgi:hypothetical protein
MAVDFRRTVLSAVSKFGRDVIYTPRLGNAVTIQGIVDIGAQLEDLAPGVYAILSIADNAVSPLPEPGEEITIDSSVYKIVRREVDAGDLARLVLRLDREVG